MPNSYKVFLSYSHSDEVLLDRFNKHLSTLKRNEMIDVWHDRKLIAGSKLDDEILTQLDQADIVIFLISADFLSSYYCYDVELTKALHRKQNSDLCVIPLILHPCDWEDGSLGEFTAIPSDGQPVTLHASEDTAFLDCVKKIKEVVTELEKVKEEKPSDKTDLSSLFLISEEFTKELENTEVVFQNRHKDSVELSDIFVYPDLRVFDEDAAEGGGDVIALSADEILNDSSNTKVSLIMSGEQSGKTTLAKIAFRDNYEKGFRPVLIDCSKIPTRLDIQKTITNALNEQYTGCSYNDYFKNKDQCVAILDDFNLLRFNAKFTSNFLSEITSIFNSVLVFGDSEMRYDDSRFPLFDNFEKFELLRFGYVKRDELISKWNSIGVVEVIEERELQAANDQSRLHVDSIIRRNIVPSKPIFILTILQTLETSKPSDYSLTSHGHCYHFLIQQALLKAKIPNDEFGAYINYLSELAHFIYEAGDSKINQSNMDDFQRDYSNNYIINSHEKVLSRLISAGIIKNHNENYLFCYKYIFYFYVAKHVADNITSSNAKSVVSSLCEKVHNEKQANILIFITHHTKNQEVLDEILLHSTLIFDGRTPTKLAPKDFDNIISTLESIPSLVIEQRNVQAERGKELQLKDKSESPLSDHDDDDDDDDDHDHDQDGSSDSGSLSTTEQEDQLVHKRTLADINSSAKSVEIIGQILRNRHGDLTKPQLIELAEASFGTGLRFLDFYLELVSTSEEEILGIISNLIKKDDRIDNSKIEKIARRFYVHICYEFTFGVIKKIAFSTGSDKLLGIFDEVSNKEPDSAAIKLINLAIKLEFDSSIPFKLMEELISEFKPNFVAKRMVQQLVIQHLYLHHIDITEKQRISSILGIPINTQRRIQRQRKTKIENK